MAFIIPPRPGMPPAPSASRPGSPATTGAVRRKLREGRWRIRGTGLVRTLIALVGAAALAGTGILIHYPLARDTKLGLPVLVLSGWFIAGLSVLFILWFFLLRRIPDAMAAREIEKRHPELNGAFTNAVEFQLWTGGRRKTPDGVAFDLALEEISRADRLAASLRLKPLGDWKPVRRMTLFSLVPLAAFGMLALSNTFQSRRAFSAFWAPRQAYAELRTAFESTGTAYERARIAGVRVELHYPDYLQLPPATLEASDGSLEAIRGTRVILDIRTLDNVRSARLEFADGGSALANRTDSPKPVLTVAGDRMVRAEFVLGTTGSLYVYYRRPWRFGESRTQPFRITVTDDLTPRVDMPEPAGERKVKPTDEVQVRYHASDDHLLTSVQLRLTGRVTDQVIPLPAPEAGASTAGGEYLLKLGSLDLAGEDELTVFVEAVDDDTISGPKTGSSAKARLLLRADERELLQLLDNQERILAGMIDWLGINLENYPTRNEISATTVADLFLKLYQKGREVIAALDETVNAMRENPLADENATEALSNIHKDLTRVSRKFEQTGMRFGLPGTSMANPQGVQTLLTGTAKDQVPVLEKHILFLDTLISKQRLDEALRPREEIDALKSRIRELMEEYRKTGDKALLEQIRKLANRLKDVVNRTMTDAARRFDEIPDEFVNKTEQHKEVEKLQKLSDQLAGEDFDSLESLENYLSQLDESFGNMDLARSSFAGEAFFKDLGKLANLEQKVAALEKEQKEIVKEIEKERGKDSGDLFTKEERSKLDQGLQEARARLDNAARLQSARERGLYQQMQEARRSNDMHKLQELQKQAQAEQMQRLSSRLGNSAQAVESAKRDLEMSNLGGALATLKGLERETQKLSQETSDRPSSEGQPGPRMDTQKARKEIGDAAGLLQKKLAQAAGTGESGKKGDKNKLARLGERQERARKQAEDLAKQLQELAEGSPMVPGNNGPEMESAASEMGESAQQVGSGRPQAALSPSASASSRLQGIRQSLGEARQRMENGMRPGGNSPGGSGGTQRGGRSGGKGGDGLTPFDEQVEIPKSDESRAKNKDEIIDAMKEPAPKSYTPQNRDYYKNLMQN